MPTAPCWWSVRRRDRRPRVARTSENSVKKLSEKSCRHPKLSCTEPRHRTVRPILAPIYRPIPRSERRSNPFSDSFKAKFGEIVIGEVRRRPLPRRWMNSGGGSGLNRVTSTGGPISNERSIYHGRRRCEGRLRLLRRLEGQRLRHHALLSRR